VNLLVTGAAGFVGSHLIPALVERGHTVVAVDYKPDRLPDTPGVTPFIWDLTQPDAPFGLPPVDVILHLAQSNVPFPGKANDMFAVHVACTQRLLEHARTTGAKRFIFTSTGSVYGGGERPWREDDPPSGAGFYAATKVAAERLIEAYGGLVPYTIFRLFTPYGPGQVNRLIPGLINRIRTGNAVTAPGGTGPTFNPLYVTHVVDALVQAVEAKGNQLLNLAGDEALSVRQMAEAIGRVSGKDPKIEDTPGTGDKIVGDTTRLRTLYHLPERLVTFEEGVRAMIAAGS
jgi:UDP-glucose 4-epimerase